VVRPDGSNPNIEYLNPKQIQISNIRNQGNESDHGLDFGHSILFRISIAKHPVRILGFRIRRLALFLNLPTPAEYLPSEGQR
jgi:hypothetical protein